MAAPVGQLAVDEYGSLLQQSADQDGPARHFTSIFGPKSGKIKALEGLMARPGMGRKTRPPLLSSALVSFAGPPKAWSPTPESWSSR